MRKREGKSYAEIGEAELFFEDENSIHWMNLWNFWSCPKCLGPAQNILGPVKGQGKIVNFADIWIFKCSLNLTFTKIVA